MLNFSICLGIGFLNAIILCCILGLIVLIFGIETIKSNKTRFVFVLTTLIIVKKSANLSGQNYLLIGLLSLICLVILLNNPIENWLKTKFKKS